MKVGVPTFPTVPPAPASPARGGLATLESATGSDCPLFSRSWRRGGRLRVIGQRLHHDLRVRRPHAGRRSLSAQVVLRLCSDLNNNTMSRQTIAACQQQVKGIECFKASPRDDRDTRLQPKEPRPNRCRHLRMRRIQFAAPPNLDIGHHPTSSPPTPTASW
jgi:hypothetical protein